MQKTSDEVRKIFDRGEKFFRFHEFHAAREALKTALKMDDTFSPAWNLLGRVNRDSGKIEDARRCFREAMASDPDWLEPIQNLGSLEFSQDNYDESVKLLKEYHKMDGSDPEALLTLSRAAFEIGDCKTVLAVTSKIIDINDELYQAWSMRGICQAKTERFNAACTSLNVAIELNPGAISSLNTVGEVCFDSKNYERAIEFYEMSLKANQKQPIPFFRIGASLWYLDRWADAITFFENYVDLAPDDPKGWNNLGVALREKGEVKRAIECYNKALILDPSLEIVRTNMKTAKDMQLIL
ncbi:MAG: tetratricopeptide repeat protein [Candidatus Thorarchaeota archaeon]|jgi:protein O-GlcNAc transferase